MLHVRPDISSGEMSYLAGIHELLLQLYNIMRIVVVRVPNFEPEFRLLCVVNALFT